MLSIAFMDSVNMLDVAVPLGILTNAEQDKIFVSPRP